jgi:hypothetical protein
MAGHAGAHPAPPELEEAKRAFERAHTRYLAARTLCEELAQDVVVTGDRMTALYHEWQREHAARALADNRGRRAPGLGPPDAPTPT